MAQVNVKIKVGCTFQDSSGAIVMEGNSVVVDEDFAKANFHIFDLSSLKKQDSGEIAKQKTKKNEDN